MKTSFRAIRLLGVLLASPSLMAVPQNVGGGGQFFNARNNVARLPVQDWFLVAAHWKAGVEVPGAWTAEKDAPEKRTMTEPGPVFGIEAYSLQTEAAGEGGLARVTALYEVKGSAPDFARRLSRNISLVMGTEGKAEGTATLWQKDGFRVTMEAAADGFQKVVFLPPS